MPNGSNDRLLADTNVLVYAVDRAEAGKSVQAGALLEAAFAAGRLALSAQVCTEFYDAVTRPRSGGRSPLLARRDAHRWVERWLSRCDFLVATEEVTRDIVRIASRYRFRIFDAQLLATARAHGVKRILTEDFPAGEFAGGVRYIDPFSPSFRLAQIGL